MTAEAVTTGGCTRCGGADTTPDPFAVVDQTDVPLSSLTTSNAITVSGITTAAPVSVTGGEYEINAAGAWVTSAGSVDDGDTVRVRHTSSATPATTTNTTLTIGGVSDTFSTTTVPADTTPDPFAFVNQTDVPLSALTTSNAITVSGINTSAPVSITHGERGEVLRRLLVARGRCFGGVPCRRTSLVSC